MLEYKRCLNQKEIYNFVGKVFRKANLPKKKNALIFIKPNINNEINALMGGTTDLRLIYAVLSFLKKKDYNNIIVGDGPNVGSYHGKVDVFSRLKLDKLCNIFKVKLIDLNYEPCIEVIIGKRKVKIAKICFDADYFVNLPKIKCHIESGMSICLKNLVGVCRGYEKRKLHWDLNENIILLNEIVKPDLHIVDGLVIMEGDGPSAGFPRLLDYLIAGTDPFEVDSACSKLVGVNNFKTLKNDEDVNVEKVIDIKKAKGNLLSKIFLKNYFVVPRYWKIFNFFISSGLIHKILFGLGIRQTPFVKDDDEIKRVFYDDNSCINCKTCYKYCPLSINFEDEKEMERCIKCLYCYFVCPSSCIKVDGELGYLKPLIKRYGLPINGIK